MWIVCRFNKTGWVVRPYNGDMYQFDDPRHGATRNIIAVFHREVDAQVYAQMLNSG